MKLYYLIETIDAIIISQSPATAETHKTLDYIPGSTILGAIASKCYTQGDCDENRSWNMFHSGQIKFANAYIASKSKQQAEERFDICYPTPLSWHVPKGKKLYKNKSLNPELQNQIHKNSKPESNQKIQYKQCRSGYITANKQKIEVQLGSSTKTAINEETETVEESQLFNYNYIKAGQKFIAWIEADEGTLNEIEQYLTGVTRLGRSRSTEFGRVKIKLLGNQDSSIELIDVNKDEQITIWLTSDCQILDENSFPVFAPKASEIGLPDADLELSKSFIINRKNILYNRKRVGFDSEINLINKGCVLVYTAKVDISAKVLQKLQQKGIGLNQQFGFGNIIINPQWSKKFNPTQEETLFAPIIFELKAKTTSNIDTGTILINWVNEKSQILKERKVREQQVKNYLLEIVTYYLNGRSYNGISNKHNAGPTKNQWGKLYQFSRDSNKPITNSEFNKIVKTSEIEEKVWDLDWDEGENIEFVKKFMQLLTSIDSIHTQRQLLENLNKYHLETYEGLKQLGNTINIKDICKEQDK